MAELFRQPLGERACDEIHTAARRIGDHDTDRPIRIGIGLSGDQRFFAGWTQAWRAKARDESLRQQLLADPHAPDAVRATAPLRHVPEFYSAFDVKAGDKLFLAPDQRVKIW